MDLLAYLRLAFSEYDSEALDRVLNKPSRGLGKTACDKVRIGTGVKDRWLPQMLESPANLLRDTRSIAAVAML